jgi:2-polyprenyl-3-methyl-5-hydroxy-6-metoxy-1,4-benzoquinol methylase
VSKTYSSIPRGERQEEASCPLCGSAGANHVLRGQDFAFVRCPSCSTVYQNPRPIFTDLRKRYGSDYFAYELENEGNFFELMKLGLGDIDFDAITKRFSRPRSFLDIGCATGMLIQWMGAKGWECEGVDVCRESAEFGIKNRQVRISTGTLEEARYPSAFFSVVHFSHLIEHVPDPRGFLREVRRILKKDGFVVITTPNIEGFQARLFKERWRSAIADHLTLFSIKTMRRLLEEERYTIRQTVTWGGLAAGTAPWFIKRPMDKLAKRIGIGDVMLFLAEKCDI